MFFFCVKPSISFLLGGVMPRGTDYSYCRNTSADIPLKYSSKTKWNHRDVTKTNMRVVQKIPRSSINIDMITGINLKG